MTTRHLFASFLFLFPGLFWAQTDTPRLELAFDEIHSASQAIAIAPQGNAFAVAFADSTLQYWTEGQASTLNTLQYSGGRIELLAIDPTGFPPIRTEKYRGAFFANDGQTIYTVGYTDELLVGGTVFTSVRNTGVVSLTAWPVTSAEALHVNSAMQSVALLPSGRKYVTTRDEKAELRTFADTTATYLFPDTAQVAAVAVSRDGQYLACGTKHGVVILYALTRQEEIHRFKAFEKSIHTLQFSPNGQCLVVGEYAKDKGVSLWSVKNPSNPVRIGDLEILAGEHAFSPDSRQLLVSSADWESLIYKTSSNATDQGTKVGPERSLFSNPAFSSDGRYYAGTVRPDFNLGDSIRVWDARTHALVQTMQGSHLSGARVNIVSSLAFSPDGRFLLSGGMDSNMKLWHIPTGQLLRTFAHHDYENVTRVGFSQNGRYLFSSSESAVKLWHNLFTEWYPRLHRLSEQETAKYLPYEIGPVGSAGRRSSVAAASTQPSTGTKRYAIQVGSFQTIQADIMLAKMIELGYTDAYITECTNELGNTFRRVIAAVYTDRAAAHREPARMKREYDLKDGMVRTLENE